jgi:hypothetical protein
MTNTTTIDAQLVLNQIGHKALFMIGAKNYIKSDKYVSFKIMRNSCGVTHIRITLNVMDLYDVEFLNCNIKRIVTKNTLNNIYYDQLAEIISENTGLNVRL